MADLCTNCSSDEFLLNPTVEYFSHEAPRAFKFMKCIAVNAHGDIFFGVRADFRSILNTDTGEVTTEKLVAEIAKYHVKSGDSIILPLDPAIATEDLRRIIDFYVLNDFLGVLVTYNRIDYTLKQHLLVMDHKLVKARKTYERTVEMNGFSFDVSLGMGMRHRGRILVVGGRGPLDGEREVVAASISADPRPWDVVKFPDVNLSSQIAEFATFLKSENAEWTIFPQGVFWQETDMYFLIKELQHSIVQVSVVGKMRVSLEADGNHKNDKGRFDILDTKGRVVFSGGITTGHLQTIVHSGRQLWIIATPPNYALMDTLSWKIYYKILPFLVRGIVWGLNLTLRLRPYDGGRTLTWFLHFLRWCNGPDMTPTVAPPSLFLLYNLDLKNLLYKKVNYNPPLNPSTRYFLPVLMDSDVHGGLLLMDSPAIEDKFINVQYFAPPHQPPSLAKICENVVYRNYPAFERSENLRRSLGICDFRWKL